MIIIFSDRVLWEWYAQINITSALTKASALGCTTVWSVEPSRNMVGQDFMEWLLFNGY